MGVGYGFNPATGSFGPVITFDSDSDDTPDSYDYRFETDDGVIINVNVETENAARAETVRVEIGEKLGWKGKPLEDEESEPTVGSAVGEGFLAGLLALLAFAVIIPATFILLDAFDWLDASDWRIGFITVRASIGIALATWFYVAFNGIQKLQQTEDPASKVIQR